MTDMRPSLFLLLAPPLLVAAACAASPGAEAGASPAAASPASTAPRPLVVPRFAEDDARVNTAGFVGLTTQVDRESGGTTHTLMVFAVGEVLTLGAMVEGDFDGRATWQVGARSFSVPLRRANRGSSSVTVEGEPLQGRHGGFRDFDWVNVEVPLSEWLPDGTPVRLEFRAADGSHVAVPAAGSYAARVEAR